MSGPGFGAPGMISSARARSFRSGLLVTACALIALALLIPLLSAEGSPLRVGAHSLGAAFELAAAGLGLLVAAVVVWWARRRGRFDPFEPPVWFSLNAYGQVVLNVWLLQRDVHFRPFVANMATESTPVAAVLLMAIGLSALWVGYLAATRYFGSRPGLARHVPRQPRWHLIVGLWFVCTLVQALSVVAGAIGYLSLTGSVWTSYLAFAGHLGDLAAFVLLLHHFRHPRATGWLWLLVVIATNVVLGLVVGTKTAVLVLLYIVMAIYYARRRLSARWLALGFLALLLVVPTVNSFRTNLYAAGFDRTAGAGFGDRLPILVSSVSSTLSNPLSGLAEQTRDTFEQRQGSLLEITVSIMAVHPNLKPFVGLDMLAELAVQTIPRVFWPGKPAGHPDLYLILSLYLGVPDYTWATPGQFGDAYRAGGWPLVVLWLCLLGAVMAWFYARGPGRGELAGTAFYLLILTSFVTYDGHLLRVIMELPKFVVLLWLVNNYLLFRPASRQSSKASPPGGAGARQGLPGTKGLS